MTSSSDLLDLSIEELSTIQITTVTGASKYEQKVTEAPSSISIITSDDIRKFGYRTLADVLRSVRSFYVTYDRNYSYYGVRGFSRPGDFNTRVLLLVDGHRINDNVYDQAPLGTEFLLDMDLVNRIEVIRGPGSSLYGSNAFFGVINIITKSGGAVQGTELAASAASLDTYAGRISYGTSGPGGFNMLLSGSGYDSKGNAHLSYPEFAGINNGRADHRDNDRSHNFFSKISYRDFSFEGAYGYREKGVPTASYGSVFNAPDNRTIDENMYLDAAYRHVFADGISVVAKLSYDEKNYWEDYLMDYPPPTRNRDTAFGKWWTAEAQATGLFFQRHKVSAGAEYKDNIQQDQSNFDIDPPFTYLDDRRRSRLHAFYVEDEYRISDRLLANVGLRYDHYSSFGDTTNPRLALIYAPARTTIFKLLYGTAFRAPNVFELYYNDGITAKSNPNLKPEKIKTYELVYEQYLGPSIRTSVSGFSYRIENLITSVTDPGDGMSQFQNSNRTETRGIEMELEGKWQNGIRGRASYSVQKAKDMNTGEVLTNSPEQLGKVNIIVPLIKERVFLDPEYQYMSSRKTVGNSREGAFSIVNVTLYGRDMLKHLDIAFSVYNVFDTKYGDPGAGPPQHVQDVIPQDGRLFRIKLTYVF
ncbi:MAG TPA: TonB-dependent receptor [Nitrospirota bacterium]|nr:TonB-dependent receptor [Nitrospirota bacterium]